MQNLRLGGQPICLHVRGGEQLHLRHDTSLIRQVYGDGCQGRGVVRTIGGFPRGGKDVHGDGVPLVHTKAEITAVRRAVEATGVCPIGGVLGVEEPNQPCGVRPDGRVDHAHVLACKSTRGHEADHYCLLDGVAHRIRRHPLGVQPVLFVPGLPVTSHFDSQLVLDEILHFPHAIVGEVPEEERRRLIADTTTLHWRFFVHHGRRRLPCSQCARGAITQRGVLHSAGWRQEGHGGEVKGPGWTDVLVGGRVRRHNAMHVSSVRIGLFVRPVMQPQRVPQLMIEYTRRLYGLTLMKAADAVKAAGLASSRNA